VAVRDSIIKGLKDKKIQQEYAKAIGNALSYTESKNKISTLASGV